MQAKGSQSEAPAGQSDADLALSGHTRELRNQANKGRPANSFFGNHESYLVFSAKVKQAAR